MNEKRNEDFEELQEQDVQPAEETVHAETASTEEIYDMTEEQKREKEPGATARPKRTFIEQRDIMTDQLQSAIENLMRESTVRRIKVIAKDGRVILDIPAWAAALGGVAAILYIPILTAVGVLGGVYSGVKLEIEREVDDETTAA